MTASTGWVSDNMGLTDSTGMYTPGRAHRGDVKGSGASGSDWAVSGGDHAEDCSRDPAR
jgi:hypothetical protein